MKNYITLIAFAIVATVFTGCNSKKIEIPEPPVKDYTQVPLYMAGQEIPGDAQEKYLYNASVKMYSVGRLVDPGNGTMREAGTIYRIESAPAWNLIPQYDANPESFARQQLQEQYADTVAGQINRSMQETREVKYSLNGIHQELAGSKTAFQSLAEENSRLNSELKKQGENAANMLEGMKKMQRYIELLEQKVNDRNTMNIGVKK